MSFTGPTRVDDNAFDVVESSQGVVFLMRKEGLLVDYSPLSAEKFSGQKRRCLTVDSLQVSEHEAQTVQSFFCASVLCNG